MTFLNRRLFRKSLLVLGSLVFSLVVVEIGLRVVGFSDPSLFYIYDHDRGTALRPLAEGWWLKERANYIRMNSEGFHDREHTIQKPTGALRIAVLGDSYTEAMALQLDETFEAEIERRLQACPKVAARKIEVLNFGVSGYGTAQELITLRNYVWKYSPDVVLLAVTPGNDVNDNFKQLSADTLRPYFIYRNNVLTLDRSGLEAFEQSRTYRLRYSIPGRAVAWLRQHLRILQLLNLTIQRATNRNSRPVTARNQPTGDWSLTQTALAFENQPPSEPGLDTSVYVQPENETWKQAWRVTEGLIAEVRTEVESHGAKFGLFTVTNAMQVMPDDSGSAKELIDLEYPDRRIQAFAQREGFPELNLAPLLKDIAVKQQLYLHGWDGERGTGHWNRDGHRIAGDLIADWMCTWMAP